MRTTLPAGFGRESEDAAVIALGCYLTMVVLAIAEERAAWWVFVLAGCNVLPLLWRRRFPFTVTVWVHRLAVDR